MHGAEQPECIFWQEKYSTDCVVAQVSTALSDCPLRFHFKSQGVMHISASDYSGIFHRKTAVSVLGIDTTQRKKEA